MVEFVFKKCHMSTKKLDFLCDLMALLLVKHHDSPPFTDHKDLYDIIDATQLGDVPWQCFSVKHTEECPEVIPPWMDKEYDFWFRDPSMMAQKILANPTYKDEIDYDEISKDPDTHGSAFVLIILGSDKTTVSVGMGNNEYYLLYASTGNVHNNVFLAIPKTDKKNANDEVFRMFHHQLYHSSLSMILQSLKPLVTKYEVIHCGDGHFRHIIYGIGPYIADYKEQVVLGSDIYELLSPDILHQLIKGAFKDYLVDWVLKYLKLIHGTRWTEEIMSDIDCRVAAVASFSGLQQFPQGHDFKQWTGDNSKVLMKVFISAIEGHVHEDIMHCFHALLEFYYLVRRNVITKDTLNQIEDALTCFHHYCQIFLNLGVISTVSLPYQHSMSHHHIKAVKEPWQWSSKHNTLGQMLMSNQHLDKLAASCVDFGA
ncbi:hypothetical protein BDR05DRAFT_977286 [Suillus weaverae]|nr:hypothetical protein BDR05DRAFT_977286 [Suillus weaverae]